VSLELATPRHRDAPPLIGLVCSTESSERQRCHAYQVSANPLWRYRIPMPRHLRPGRLWGLRAAAHSRHLTRREILSRALAPFQSFTHAPPHDPGLRIPKDLRHTPCPFRGLFPFNVFPAVGSHIPPTRTYPCRLRFALRVSHPLDALLPPRPAGLISFRSRPWGLPFEALILPRCRTPSRTPPPSWGSVILRRSEGRPSRVRKHTARSPPTHGRR
jgi:hypothetical protein